MLKFDFIKVIKIEKKYDWWKMTLMAFYIFTGDLIWLYRGPNFEKKKFFKYLKINENYLAFSEHVTDSTKFLYKTKYEKILNFNDGKIYIFF